MSVKSTISRSCLSRTTGTDVHEKYHSSKLDDLHQRDTKGQRKTDFLGNIQGIEEEDTEATVMDIFSLDYFPASMFATVIEDSITALRVLDECNNELRIIKTNADMEYLRALKYSVKQPALKDELDGIELHNLDKMEYKLNKLVSDRKFFADSLLKTYLSLSLNRNWKSLANIVNRIVDRRIHFEYLVDEEIKYRLNRRELMRQLRQQRIHIKSVVYENDVIIDRLQTQVEDAVLNAEVRSRYIDNWQRARTEQHQQLITNKEAGPTEVIEYYKERSDQEQRVHAEVETLINLGITENLHKIEIWMNKYDKDMENLDLKIQIKKLEYQNAFDKRIQLEDTIAKHNDFMNDWITFKEEREKARQYREKMTNAAITVQAWWRGLLVRLELGPYKRVKKKGGASAGKKKK
ncbi:hypothetical protein K1T71_010939 [Dendrolimus kikuchii]|uniref:Uncharacterized protein n=1 Tax=Dendrolimus kikuchii TaxID=765133 RepID=A0ACC1CQE0_9NEOP|nr:hypothetical protein K1T71_010939 [Dendrolimus kikuchii]